MIEICFHDITGSTALGQVAKWNKQGHSSRETDVAGAYKRCLSLIRRVNRRVTENG
jgi:hypothetical protein